MAVSLPTAADVRKVREQAARTAAERAEAAKTPLLAVLGAGDRVVTGVSKAAAHARTVAEVQAEAVQSRVMDLPAEFDGLRARLRGEELRRSLDALRTQLTDYYAGLAQHGELAWEKFRKQPQVEQAFARLEGYTEKLDSRVDELVDDAHDAAEKALATVTRQTRVSGEKVAGATRKAADEAATTVAEVSGEASRAVDAAGMEAAEAIEDAGVDVARSTRAGTRKAAQRTAPKTEPKTEPKTAPKTAPETAPETAPTTEAKAEPKAAKTTPRTAAPKPATGPGTPS